MTGRRGSSWAIVAVAGWSVLAYAAAAPEPAEAMLALVATVLGAVLSSRRVGIHIPRWGAGALAVLVLLRTINGAFLDGLDVLDFARLVLWLLVIKMFDRRHGVDDAQAIALTVFLCVASVLLSNGVTVALISFAYLPCLSYAAMRVQLGLQAERADRLAGRHLDGDRAVPPIRPASSAGTRRSLLRTSLAAVGGGFLMAIVVFVVVPRGAGLSHIGNWGNPGVGRVVGFNDRIDVGMGGVISLSNTPVLHLRVSDGGGSSVGGMGAVQYLRGAVLDTYQDGVWLASSPPNRFTPTELIKGQSVSFPGPGREAKLYQEITVLNTPPDFSYLFTIWRPQEIRFVDPGVVAKNETTMTAMHLGPGGKFKYTVRSSPYEADISARRVRPVAGFDSRVVARVASEILRARGIEPDPDLRHVSDDASAIGAFRQHFWSNYTYRLETPPSPDGIDPVEWFLTEGSEGHCEYYAASMAALCRSVGIPARVVTGYLAVEFNGGTQHYVVRESNAHAWIEAQTEPGIWNEFDPTPPADLLAAHAPESGLLARAGRALDALNYSWVSSVVAFDSDRRSDMLGWSDPATKSLQEQVARALDFTRLTPSAVLIRVSIHVLITVVGGFLAGYAIIMLMRRVRLARARRPRAMIQRIEDRETRDRVLASSLYQDLLKALLRGGLRKPSWQPLSDWTGDLERSRPGIGRDAAEVARLFYIVRFGGRELTPLENRRASELLSAIRERLQASDNTSISS